MGFLSGFGPKATKNPTIVKPNKGKFHFAEREWDRVKWWQNARLRKLYLYCVVLILNNVANGFDGS